MTSMNDNSWTRAFIGNDDKVEVYDDGLAAGVVFRFSHPTKHYASVVVGMSREHAETVWHQLSLLLHPDTVEEPVCAHCAAEAKYGPKSMQEA